MDLKGIENVCYINSWEKTEDTLKAINLKWKYANSWDNKVYNEGGSDRVTEEGVNNLLENIDYWKKAPVWDENSINEATKSWFKYLS